MVAGRTRFAKAYEELVADILTETEPSQLSESFEKMKNNLVQAHLG